MRKSSQDKYRKMKIPQSDLSSSKKVASTSGSSKRQSGGINSNKVISSYRQSQQTNLFNDSNNTDRLITSSKKSESPLSVFDKKDPYNKVITPSKNSETRGRSPISKVSQQNELNQFEHQRIVQNTLRKSVFNKSPMRKTMDVKTLISKSEGKK